MSAAVKGWPAYPKGSTVPADTLTGDSIQLSGYGLGYGTTQPTQEQRTAIMGFDDASTYDVSGPIHWGDSGGPLVHKRTGKALGIVSRLCAGACSEEGPTVQGILAKAAAAGYRGHAAHGLSAAAQAPAAARTRRATSPSRRRGSGCRW